MRVRKGIPFDIVFSLLSIFVVVAFFILIGSIYKSSYLMGVVIVSYLVRMKYRDLKGVIRIDDKGVRIIDGKHDIKIARDFISEIKYSGHKLVISANGLDYFLDLTGYSAKKVKALIDERTEGS